ncbi:MAG: hypothetical protein MR784_01810, partial [Rikenellaceae bacterium]|nr:hypothetical protein [Rikenellaceae bacterium]
KSYLAIIALGALVIASCQKENSADLPKVDSPVFTATLDADSDTKTVLNGNKSEWVSGDAIRVLNGTGGSAVYTTADEGASATFKTTEGFTGTQFLALYPANESAIWKADYPTYINGLQLSPIQTAKEGSYDSAAHLAYAYADGNSLLFKNMVALLKFTIAEGSNEVSSISVSVPTPASGNTGYLAGNMTYDTNSKICYNEGGSLSATVALTGTFVAGQTYYMAVLPGTYSEFSLSVNGITVNKKSSEVTFKSGKIYNLGSVRAPFNWGVVGKFNGWDLSSPALLYDTDADGIYELKGQSLAGLEGVDEGFKFVRVPDCSWTYAFGVHAADYKFDTQMGSNWYDVYTDKISDKKENILVSDTSKKWDIYIYETSSGTWGQGLRFSVLPEGTATPRK